MPSLLRDRIAEAMRRQPGLSQADVARACGVKTPSVADWLNGKTKSLKPEPARRGAALFGCDQNWLATGIGTPNWGVTLSAQATAGARATADLSVGKPPELHQALPVVLDAIAQCPDRPRLRTALLALLEDDAAAYRQRVAELLEAPAEAAVRKTA